MYITIWEGGAHAKQAPIYCFDNKGNIKSGLLFKEDGIFIHTDGMHSEVLNPEDSNIIKQGFYCMNFRNRIPLFSREEFLNMIRDIDYDSLCLVSGGFRYNYYSFVKLRGRQILVISPWRGLQNITITCFENVGYVSISGVMEKINNKGRQNDEISVIDLSSADLISYMAANLSGAKIYILFRLLQRVGPGAVFGPDQYYEERDCIFTIAQFQGKNYEEMEAEWQKYLIGRGRFTKPAIRAFE